MVALLQITAPTKVQQLGVVPADDIKVFLLSFLFVSMESETPAWTRASLVGRMTTSFKTQDDKQGWGVHQKITSISDNISAVRAA